jgi:hypothetical protein
LPEYNRFDYHPRYFDPQKEALEKRKSIIDKEIELEKQGKSEFLKSVFKRDGFFYRRAKTEKQSNIRLVIIMGILFLVAYFLLYY